MRFALMLLTCLTTSVVLLGAASPDTAIIMNSGSTNFTGWNITIHTGGNGSVVQAAHGVAIEGKPARPFRITPELAAKFFHDLRAVRDARIAGTACMKSVSFGTRLTVAWHGWVSPDLSCPVASALAASLRDDVSQITTIVNPPSGFHRIRLPIEPHRVPETTPATP